MEERETSVPLQDIRSQTALMTFHPCISIYSLRDPSSYPNSANQNWQGASGRCVHLTYYLVLQTNRILYTTTILNLLCLNTVDVIEKWTHSSTAHSTLKPTLVCGANLERCHILGLISSERR